MWCCSSHYISPIGEAEHYPWLLLFISWSTNRTMSDWRLQHLVWLMFIICVHVLNLIYEKTQFTESLHNLTPVLGPSWPADDVIVHCRWWYTLCWSACLLVALLPRPPGAALSSVRSSTRSSSGCSPTLGQFKVTVSRDECVQSGKEGIDLVQTSVKHHVK